MERSDDALATSMKQQLAQVQTLTADGYEANQSWIA